MEYVRSIIVKLIMIGVITLAVLTLFAGINPLTSIYIALVITAITYIIGDILVLPNFGNLTSTITNGVIAFLVTWLSTFVIPGLFISVALAIAVGIIVALADWFYHKYLKRVVIEEGQNEG